MQRVAATRIVYSGELLPALFVWGVTVDSGESFFKILKESPCLKRDIEAKSQPWK
jgi:hypothetical protein